MDNKKGVNFFLLIILIITGSKLYKHIDFKNWKFEKPLLDTIYLIAFVLVLVYFIKELVQRRGK